MLIFAAATVLNLVRSGLGAQSSTIGLMSVCLSSVNTVATSGDQQAEFVQRKVVEVPGSTVNVVVRPPLMYFDRR